MSAGRMTRRGSSLAGLAVILLGATALLLATCHAARSANHGDGFPLDDPWIHLQFARNLREHGSFSYFEDRQVTSGSTSPLYTVTLALGMAVIGDEYMLSYLTGGAFALVAAALAFRIAGRLFAERLLPSLAVAGIVASEPRLVWAALSGMETTLFIALLLAVLACHVERRPRLLGACAGLLLWARPDGLLMVAAVAIASFYDRVAAGPAGGPPDGSRPLRPSRPALSLSVFALLAAAYAAFNLALSGTLFPNTLNAKLAYYSGGGQRFLEQALSFLTAGPMIVIAPLAAVGGAATALAVFRRRPAPLLAPLVFAVGIVAAYWWKLPHLYQNGRYLMPALPFMTLLAVAGLGALSRLAASELPTLRPERRRHAVEAIVLAGLVLTTAAAAWNARPGYTASCRYISERQVATADWIRLRLPADAIVATHDVGALAFRSGRRVVDMVGLISPEMIETIGRSDMLFAALERQDVTHLAVLRSWFAIDNVNPIFVTDELRPEVMEVFRFDPRRMHVTLPAAAAISERARLALADGRVDIAGPLLERAVAEDPGAARIRTLLGRALTQIGRLDEAVRELDLALTLHPDLWDARFYRADLAVRRRDATTAIAILERLIGDNPSYEAAYRALARLYSSTDPQRADGYRRRADELTATPGGAAPP